jgi:hypothetical protein
MAGRLAGSVFGALLAVAVVSVAPPTALAATVRHVSTTGTDSGDCSVNACRTIGYAISQSASGDTISIASGTYAEHVVVDRSLTLQGAGSGTTAIDGSGTGRVVMISSSRSALTVKVSGVTIRNGFVDAGLGGGVESLPSVGQTYRITITSSVISANRVVEGSSSLYPAGGGIFNGPGSDMKITATAVQQNSVTGGNGAIPGEGGGIANSGHLTLQRVTVSGNTALGGPGGVSCRPPPQGCFALKGGPGYGGGEFGSVTMVNSTVSGNAAIGGIEGPCTTCGHHEGGGDGYGGGALCTSDATIPITLVNTSVAGNQASGGSGTPNGQGFGGGLYGGLYCPPGITLTNSIVASNVGSSGPDCDGTVTSGGHNLLGSDSSCSGFTGVGDLVNVDPVLGPLQNNGGPTLTIALLSGSPAIDAADDAVCAAPPVNGKDQRGVARPQGPHCDIGAYEKQ